MHKEDHMTIQSVKIECTDVDIRTIGRMTQEIMRLVERADGSVVGFWCNSIEISMRCTDQNPNMDWRTVEITHSPFSSRREDMIWFTQGNRYGAIAYYLDCIMQTYGAPTWS